jgi:hypothetical protein
MFRLDDFPHRIVATVDNLGRTHASPWLWPINPTDGHFTVMRLNGEELISFDNGLRYIAFIKLMETVDLHRLVELYAQFYSVFQKAYENIGYPKGYFNDRLVEVIDQLLAAPEPDLPLKVHLPKFNGPTKPERLWLLYEFDDPTLQTLNAGQKILLRMGPSNERSIKNKLIEFRRLVTAGVHH